MWAGIDVLKAEYDADKGSMKVSVNVVGTHEGFHHHERHSLSIGWDMKSAPTDHYAASNAFGARTNVTAFTTKLYGIAFPVAMTWNGQSALTMGPMDYPLFVSFPMESSKAQLLSKRLRVLVVCTITTAPHAPVSNASDYASATFENPTTSNETYLYLHVRPTELWVFDSETGEVFAKSKDAFPAAYEF
jgi:hypothetical protein